MVEVAGSNRFLHVTIERFPSPGISTLLRISLRSSLDYCAYSVAQPAIQIPTLFLILEKPKSDEGDPRAWHDRRIVLLLS
jgi:hypothetical protein